MSTGDEIAPMLENIAGGVKEGQDAGLIFTEEDIQAAKDYQAAVADLGSEWDGFLTNIGKKLVPVLTGLLVTLRETEYGAGMWGMKYGVQNAEELEAALGGLNGTAEDATAATDDATWSVDGYGNAALVAGGEVEVFGSNSKRSAEEVDAMRIAAQETQKQIEDLQKALEGANLQLDVAIRTFSESIGGELAQGLKDAGLEGDELLERLGLIDQAFGTSYVLEYQMELNVDDLLDTLINDPDNFLPDAQQFLDYFTPLQESVITAMGKVDELETQLSELERTWNIRVKITTEGGFPTSPTVTPPTHAPVAVPKAAGGAVHAAASGVAASLPHYWVGELGPEPFFPSVDGRIVSNTQAMSALRGGAGADAAQIADAVKRGVKEAMKEANGGNVYNLTMPTSSNPADVKMAFELMEAWGT